MVAYVNSRQSRSNQRCGIRFGCTLRNNECRKLRWIRGNSIDIVAVAIGCLRSMNLSRSLTPSRKVDVSSRAAQTGPMMARRLENHETTQTTGVSGHTIKMVTEISRTISEKSRMACETDRMWPETSPTATERSRIRLRKMMHTWQIETRNVWCEVVDRITRRGAVRHSINCHSVTVMIWCG